MPRAVLITALLTWGLTPTLEAQGKVRYDSYTLENGLRAGSPARARVRTLPTPPAALTPNGDILP